MTGKRRWSDKTVQRWADRWAAKLGLAEVPRIITDAAEFSRLTGYKRTSKYLGISGSDYTYVKTERISARGIRNTVIHELLHLKHPTWPHWRVDRLGTDLAHGRSDKLALSARSAFEYDERAGRRLLPRDWPTSVD